MTLRGFNKRTRVRLAGNFGPLRPTRWTTEPDPPRLQTLTLKQVEPGLWRAHLIHDAQERARGGGEGQQALEVQVLPGLTNFHYDRASRNCLLDWRFWHTAATALLPVPFQISWGPLLLIF